MNKYEDVAVKIGNLIADIEKSVNDKDITSTATVIDENNIQLANSTVVTPFESNYEPGTVIVVKIDNHTVEQVKSETVVYEPVKEEPVPDNTESVTDAEEDDSDAYGNDLESLYGDLDSIYQNINDLDEDIEELSDDFGELIDDAIDVGLESIELSNEAIALATESSAMSKQAYEDVLPITNDMRDLLDEAFDATELATVVVISDLSYDYYNSNDRATIAARYSEKETRSAARWSSVYEAQIDIEAKKNHQNYKDINDAKILLYGQATDENGNLLYDSVELEGTTVSYPKPNTADSYSASSALGKRDISYQKVLKAEDLYRKCDADVAYAEELIKVLTENEDIEDREAKLESAEAIRAEAAFRLAEAKTTVQQAYADAKQAESEVDLAENGIHSIYKSAIEQTAEKISLTITRDDMESYVSIEADKIEEKVGDSLGNKFVSVTQTDDGWTLDAHNESKSQKDTFMTFSSEGMRISKSATDKTLPAVLIDDDEIKFKPYDLGVGLTGFNGFVYVSKSATMGSYTWGKNKTSKTKVFTRNQLVEAIDDNIVRTTLNQTHSDGEYMWKPISLVRLDTNHGSVVKLHGWNLNPGITSGTDKALSVRLTRNGAATLPKLTDLKIYLQILWVKTSISNINSVVITDDDDETSSSADSNTPEGGLIDPSLIDNSELEGQVSSYSSSIQAALSAAQAADAKVDAMGNNFWTDYSGAYVTTNSNSTSGYWTKVSSSGITIGNSTTQYAHFGANSIDIGQGSNTSIINMGGSASAVSFNNGAMSVGTYGLDGFLYVDSGHDFNVTWSSGSANATVNISRANLMNGISKLTDYIDTEYLWKPVALIKLTCSNYKIAKINGWNLNPSVKTTDPSKTALQVKLTRHNLDSYSSATGSISVQCLWAKTSISSLGSSFSDITGDSGGTGDGADGGLSGILTGVLSSDKKTLTITIN